MSDITKRLARLSPERRALLQQWLASRENAQAASVTIPRRPENRPIPLSFSQQRLWFLEQLGIPGRAYNVPIQIRIQGPLHLASLRQALNEMITRHEVLRTRYETVDGVPRQVIGEPFALDLRCVDAVSDQEGTFVEICRPVMAEKNAHSFSLDQGEIIRGTLFRRHDEDHLLQLNIHHIAGDRLSSNLMMRELGLLYAASSSEKPSPLSRLPIQYADYACWQRERLTPARLAPLVEYWRSQLGGLEVLELPLDAARPASESYNSSSHSFRISSRLTQAIREIGREHGATVFMTLMALFQLLLHRFSGQTSFAIGSTVGNRTRRELEDLIGFFVNLIAIRVDFGGLQTFDALLEHVKETVINALEHQELPFEVLVESLSPERDQGRHPIFQILFDHQREEELAPEGSGSTVRMSLVEFTALNTRFDIELHIFERAEEMMGCCLYNRDLFSASTIERLMSTFLWLIEQVGRNPSVLLREIRTVSDVDYSRIIGEWNQTDTPLPKELTVHGLFESVASRIPKRTAAEWNGETISYEALNRRANQVAHFLMNLGLAADQLVGICMSRGIEAVIGMLGILKSGGAYLPLDPSLPDDRMRQILDDAKPIVLLIDKIQTERFKQVANQSLCVPFGGSWMADQPESNVAAKVQPEHLSHVLYTSGSTGVPKGVGIEHRNTIALIEWSRSVYSTEDLNRVLASTSFTFDLSVFEIFVPLCRGGTVLLIENLLMLGELRNHATVTLVNSVPSAIDELLRQGLFPRGIRSVNIAGEPLSGDLVRRLYLETDCGRVINLYGPSECTTYSTFEVLETADPNPPSIGRPIANTKAYVLDSHRQPVPPGVLGELFLGGAGVGRGYLNRPELNEERFLANPFCSGGAERLYRTGDLVRFREDGKIEFVRRMDDQVKLRGFRIELTEIQAWLKRHPFVNDAVAQVIGDTLATRRIVAHVTLEERAVADQGFLGASQQSLDHGVGTEGEANSGCCRLSGGLREEIRGFLKRKLPAYMVPESFIALKAFPINANGKIDRKRMPIPAFEGDEVGARSRGPVNRTEEELIKIWCEVLEISSIGVDTNFFDGGGHSLLLPRVQALVEGRLGVAISIPLLFECPTIQTLASRLESRQAPKDRTADLSSLAQRRNLALRQRQDLRKRR